MKTLTLHIVLSALVATGVVACSKKKPATTPTTMAPGESSRQPDGAGSSDTSTGEDSLAAANASLGPVIYFEFDSTTLSPEARAELDQNAEWLRQDPARTLTIEGHTDEVGTTEYNVALGERRARAAYDYLVKLGVDPKRVEILSLGEERPASTEDSQNRRAMFIATKK